MEFCANRKLEPDNNRVLEEIVSDFGGFWCFDGALSCEWVLGFSEWVWDVELLEGCYGA